MNTEKNGPRIFAVIRVHLCSSVAALVLDSTSSRLPERRNAYALAALFAGASAIATSALFVKVSETGPVVTAFWRVALALPLLWLWASRTKRPVAHAGNRALLWGAGFFFAGDLAVWHWSIVLTSVANATLLANFAPIFVTLAAWLMFRKRPGASFLAAMSVALAGMLLLIGPDLALSGYVWLGDMLGVITAVFYAAYQITVNRARVHMSTARIMAVSSTITAVFLVPVAALSGEGWFPATAYGWLKLAGLALVAQVAGQSLIAYALAHLSTLFASVGLLLQPVVAAILAWALLGERISAWQMAGGALVLAGIGAARIAEQAKTTHGQDLQDLQD
jgi:drug/metabolite transporter (DMT)-like permease